MITLTSSTDLERTSGMMALTMTKTILGEPTMEMTGIDRAPSLTASLDTLSGVPQDLDGDSMFDLCIKERKE